MANNRMVLFHRPSGRYVHIAKRMSGGWYSTKSDEQLGKDIKEFFNSLEEYEYTFEQDDICVAMEFSRDEFCSKEYRYSTLDDNDRWLLELVEDKTNSRLL